MDGVVIVGIVFSVLLLVAAVLSIIDAIKERDYHDGADFFLDSIAPFFAIVVLVPTIMGLVQNYKEYSKELYEIVSIQRDGEVSGSFVLGCGTLKEKTYYTYYYKTDRGYRFDKKSTDRTLIIETDEVTPCLYEIKNKGTLKVNYEIYVPTNTILRTYNLE